jgi:hypothetical protein
MSGSLANCSRSQIKVGLQYAGTTKYISFEKKMLEYNLHEVEMHEITSLTLYLIPTLKGVSFIFL